MRRTREQGATLAVIGEKFGLTAERVRQILKPDTDV
jgi:DNA-directed RNA polymerase sigma subunit (sigma70/sigma32)